METYRRTTENEKLRMKCAGLCFIFSTSLPMISNAMPEIAVSRGKNFLINNFAIFPKFAKNCLLSAGSS